MRGRGEGEVRGRTCEGEMTRGMVEKLRCGVKGRGTLEVRGRRKPRVKGRDSLKEK